MVLKAVFIAWMVFVPLAVQAHDDGEIPKKSSDSNSDLPRYPEWLLKSVGNLKGTTKKEFWENWFPAYSPIARGPKGDEIPEYVWKHESPEDLSHGSIVGKIGSGAMLLSSYLNPLLKEEGVKNAGIPLEEWKNFADKIEIKANADYEGHPPLWTLEEMHQLWATLEYMHGVVRQYKATGSKEMEKERSIKTVLETVELSPEVQDQLAKAIPTGFADFKTTWREAMGKKYPKVPSFASATPEKRWLEQAKAYPSESDENKIGKYRYESGVDWGKVLREWQQK